MKSYTDIEQSKKLSKFLPLETADMMYHSVENEYGSGAFVAISKVITNGSENDDFYIDDIPCWSLAALLAFLPNSAFLERGNVTELYRITLPIELVPFDWFVEPVDACVAMIEKLHELNLL